MALSTKSAQDYR